VHFVNGNDSQAQFLRWQLATLIDQPEARNIPAVHKNVELGCHNGFAVTQRRKTEAIRGRSRRKLQ
jgi:hypothetical protein